MDHAGQSHEDYPGNTHGQRDDPQGDFSEHLVRLLEIIGSDIQHILARLDAIESKKKKKKTVFKIKNVKTIVNGELF